ncbi:uncharacterized protein LOC124635260 [Helicoverpa zea]|uniref:uncharacterized protein LOC124635260 n=1 Tax=Helicoverpa zea TaxID=7113 RepID=UPI001F5A4014|nr:uncharacterized protein LOC124635260 [Helicoverpa zea]
MQGVKIQNDLFSPSNMKYVAVNSFAPNPNQKNFINSVQNVRNTLGCLERSLLKSNEYEQQLLQCRGSHSHSHAPSHDVNQWWESEHSEEKSFKCSNTTSGTINSKSSARQEDYTDTWSSMSIVCLQYHYEELSKRYKALIEAYNEQRQAISLRDKRLEALRERANTTQAHLQHAHETLIAVGEKFLALKRKRNEDKTRFEEQLAAMKEALHDMMETTTNARMKFDDRLAEYMANEEDSDAALLLYEIRKCNLLFLENMRLKAIIEEYIPGQINWKTA